MRGTKVSQVNFFMNDDDEEVFLDSLFERKDTHILMGDRFDTDQPIPLKSTSELEECSYLTLVNKEIMPVPHASMKGKGDQFGKSFFESFYDPTIEFRRSRFSTGRLLDGRVFAKIGWLKAPGANAIYKSWYASIERWLKKRYQRVERTWWFGPGAWQWSMSGGVCCFGGELAFAASVANLASHQVKGLRV